MGVLCFRFYDKNPNGEARMGRTRGEVMTQLPDGFTKSTSVHSYGPDLNTTVQLRGQMPYVARLVCVCVCVLWGGGGRNTSVHS